MSLPSQGFPPGQIHQMYKLPSPLGIASPGEPNTLASELSTTHFIVQITPFLLWNPADGRVVWTPRPLVVGRIIERLLKYRRLLVAATPASGKTTLQHLIHQRLLKLHPDWDYVSVQKWSQNVDQFQSQEFLKHIPGRHGNDLFLDNNLVIFVDDT